MTQLAAVAAFVCALALLRALDHVASNAHGTKGQGDRRRISGLLYRQIGEARAVHIGGRYQPAHGGANHKAPLGTGRAGDHKTDCGAAHGVGCLLAHESDPGKR